MKDIFESVGGVIKSRLTNSLYGTFLVSWLIFHWGFIFSLLALDDNIILSNTGLLKNEYLVEKYFNFYDWYFWVSWIAPFFLTWIIIWKLPNWVLLDAYKQTEKHNVEKRIFKITQQRRIEQEQVRLQEQTTKKVTAVAKQAVEQKKIKDADPTLIWNDEYEKFKKVDFAYKFSSVIESYYKKRGAIADYFTGEGQFEIPEDILAYCHSNGIVEIDQKENKIEITEKGKYIINKFLEDPDKPTEPPF